MEILKTETFSLASEMDMVLARQAVRAQAQALGFKLIDQTKIVTAASELARNTLNYGGGGTMTITAMQDGLKMGIRLVFEDQGPGIPDIQQALQDGFSTGNGLGMGLGGARRLVSDFDIQSRVGQGTRVSASKWI
jgi:serine/threonine-protein kinase RsbT